jgi:hypothetical protein
MPGLAYPAGPGIVSRAHENAVCYFREVVSRRRKEL